MRLFSVFLMLSSNFLTATFITIYHYISDNYYIPSQKVPRHFELPVSLRPPLQDNHETYSFLGVNLNPIMSNLLDKSPGKIVLSNCSLPKVSPDGCSYVQFEALVNLADRTVCKCDEGRISINDQCVNSEGNSLKQNEPSRTDVLRAPVDSANDVNIFGITPTYVRLTQKVDLTSLCYTIQNIPNFIWIVVEDSKEKTKLVSGVLDRCKVKMKVHLNVKTTTIYRALRSRGVQQRNAGLSWIHKHCQSNMSSTECKKGVVYFMDDDNKYDIRLFQEMKKTVGVSVFPVGFAGGLKIEGPVCRNGSAVKWLAHYAKERIFPMDMAGFVIHITKLLNKPWVKMGFMTTKNKVRPVKIGHLETIYLEQFASQATVECRGSEKEIFVWHVKTLKPPVPYEGKHKSDVNVEV